MATANEIEIRVTVDDKTKAPFKKIEQQLKQAGDKAGKAAGKSFSAAFTKTAKGKASVAGVGGGGFQKAGEQAGNSFADGFSRGFSKIKGGTFGKFLGSSSLGGVKGIGSTFAGTFKLLSTGFRNAQVALGGLMTGVLSVGEAFKTAFTGFTGSLGQIAGGIGGVAQSVVSLGALLAGIGAIAGPALIGIGTLAAAIGGSLVVALGAGVAALGLFNVKAREAFTALGEEIQTSLARLTDQSGLTAAFQRMADVFRTTFRNLRTEIKEAMIAVQPLLDNLAAGLAQFANTLMPRVVTAVALAGPVFEGFRDMLGNLGVGLGEMFIELTKHAEGFKSFFQGLGEVFRQVLPALGDFTGVLATALGPALQTLAPVLADFVNHLGPLLANAIAQVAPMMPALFDGFNQVLAALIPLVPPLTQMAVAVLPPLASAVELVGRIIRTVLVPAFEAMVQPMMVTIATAKMVVATLEAAWLAAQGDFTAAKEVLIAGGQELDAALRGSSQSAATGFSTNLRNGVQDAREGVSTGTQNILNGILGFQGRFESGGAALGEAFRRGIIAKINAAVAAVQSAVRTIANSLPGSPAKEGPLSGRGYTKLRGQRMMMDFARGIKKGRGRIHHAIALAMRLAGGAFDFGGRGRRHGRGGRGGISVPKPKPQFTPYKGAGAPSASMLAEHHQRQKRAMGGSSGGRGGGSWHISGSADSAIACLIMRLIREGKLRIA